MKKITFDGYIVDTLMRDLVGHDKKPSSFIIYLYFWAQTGGMRQRMLAASLQQIAADTGLSKTAVQDGIRLLKRRRLIRAERDSMTAKPRYYVLRPWQRPRTANRAAVAKVATAR
jgi:DNA-binding MarR family transcriptional regulator